MLLRYFVENFSSFYEELEFSMLPGRVRKHNNHIVKRKAPSGFDILRGAILYGANASGKSNFIRSISFARELIVEGTKANRNIPIDCYRFDPDCQNRNSKFQFEFFINDTYYNYGFELNKKRIEKEWLYNFTQHSQWKIFERFTSDDGTAEIQFGNLKFENNKEKQLLEFTAMQTRSNQLYITECIEKNIARFSDVNKWFSNLIIVFPESRFTSTEVSLFKKDDLSDYFVKYLKLFDTGITDIQFVALQDVESSNIPDEVIEKVSDILRSEDSHLITISSSSRDEGRFVAYLDESGKLIINKLITKHRIKGSKETIDLDFRYESDGTKRLLDLIPALARVEKESQVFIIDELDRSLHPKLSYKFIEHFLDDKYEDSQLIATTHESSLLDTKLLRRDEIWFFEKNADGESVLYSLEEFATRSDKDLELGYLQGRFGAIPIFGNMKLSEGD